MSTAVALRILAEVFRPGATGTRVERLPEDASDAEFAAASALDALEPLCPCGEHPGDPRFPLDGGACACGHCAALLGMVVVERAVAVAVGEVSL